MITFLEGSKSEKFKKGVKVSCRGRSSWKGDWHFSYLIFLRLFLHLETTLLFAKLSYAFEQKKFSATIILEKSHSKLSKNEPENIPEIKITWYICKWIPKNQKLNFDKRRQLNSRNHSFDICLHSLIMYREG